MIAHEELLRVLRYDPETGDFWWKVKIGARCRLDRPAGVTNKKSGYHVIRIYGELYYAHRLAWFYVHGEWPTEEIDHCFGNRADNRLEKLREATSSQQKMNMKPRRDTLVGLKGVTIQGDKFLAQIKYRGRNKNLGLYDDPYVAHETYRTAATSMFGEFARTE